MRYTSLSTDQLQSWASINGVNLPGIRVQANIKNESGEDKGGGLLATTNHGAGDMVLNVPQELVLSRNLVEDSAKADGSFRQLLDALPILNQTPRGTIMIFLLYQLYIASPDGEKLPGAVRGPLTDFVKFLPKSIPLPTFWTEDERALLIGTSLADALDQKLKSLEKEYQIIREATERIEWCRKPWWGEDGGVLDLNDWKLVDAIYRSRALELPSLSETKEVAMVPVLDMANHASGSKYNARFEADRNGHVMLVVKDGKTVEDGEEITIMYGCGGATEMVFSYGFLESEAQSAREMFLNLNIPDDDPLRLAKIRYANEAPGVRLFVDDAGSVLWDSDYVWWACVNEEDGLDFRVLQTVDGQKELAATWKGQEFKPNELKSRLMEDELRDIFVLRATVLIQQRAELQGMKIAQTNDQFESARGRSGVRDTVFNLVERLRNLELELLTLAYQTLEAEKATLLESDMVRRFLGAVPEDLGSGMQDEDFS